MEIKRYNIVRNTCWKCLIECNVRTLPTPLGEICTHYGIGIVNDSDVKLLREDESGRIVCVSNTIRIIVNDRHPIQRRRYTIAHELGHYLLGHLGTDVSQLNRRRYDIKPGKESEADAFAARSSCSCVCPLGAGSAHCRRDSRTVQYVSTSGRLQSGKNEKTVPEEQLFEISA